MMKRFKIFAVILVYISFSYLDLCLAETKIKVMTFNIRFNFAEDAEKGHSWKERLPVVVKTIKETGADIVGLQEDKADQLVDLMRQLPDYQSLGEGRFNDLTGERDTIWYNPKKLTLLKNGDFWLSGTPDKAGSKTWGEKYPHKVTWAEFQVNKKKTKIMTLNTHLDYENLKSRNNSVKLIRQWLLKNAGKVPIIILGDFNVGQEDNAYRDLISKKDGLQLFDAWDKAKSRSRGLPGTFHGFDGKNGKKRCDLILVSKKIKVKKAELIKTNVKKLYPSDHFPVAAELSIK